MKFLVPAPQLGRRSARSGRASVKTKIGRIARPFDQVLDEVEEHAIRPVDVFEHHDRRPLVGDPLKQSARREQVLLVACARLL